MSKSLRTAYRIAKLTREVSNLRQFVERFERRGDLYYGLMPLHVFIIDPTKMTLTIDDYPDMLLVKDVTFDRFFNPDYTPRDMSEREIIAYWREKRGPEAIAMFGA